MRIDCRSPGAYTPTMGKIVAVLLVIVGLLLYTTNYYASLSAQKTLDKVNRDRAALGQPPL